MTEDVSLAPLTVRNHVAKILCEGHNNRSSELDEEGRNLAASIRSVFDTHVARVWAPRLNWRRRSYGISGPLLERWLLKEAINNLIGAPFPIGSADAEPGWPSSELVGMVFGTVRVARELGAGLFLVEHEHNAGDAYSMNFVTRNGTHVSAFVLSYGLSTSA